MMKSVFLAALLALSGAAGAAPAAGSTLLVFGDSLSAAYGIPQGTGWVALLGERLKRSHANYTVANASISGETSAGGAARIGAALAEHKPAIVIVALGANDGLRGLPVAQLKANLVTIIRAAKAINARVLLVGMHLPPNYGPQYVEAFSRAFADIAREERVALVPFLLEGIAEKREMFQEDNLHPVAEAQSQLLENVWKGLAPLLKPGDSLKKDARKGTRSEMPN